MTLTQNERGIALNRKNALFAGSDGGAEHWATVASLIETCKVNDVERGTSSAGSSTVIPIATSTSCCRGPIGSQTSRLWLKNSAYPPPAGWLRTTFRHGSEEYPMTYHCIRPVKAALPNEAWC